MQEITWKCDAVYCIYKPSSRCVVTMDAFLNRPVNCLKNDVSLPEWKEENKEVVNGIEKNK